MNDAAILVLTSRSVRRLQDEGGSRAWKLDPKRARKHGYLVCAWNSGGEYANNRTDRQHGEAYLVAPITTVDPTPEEPGRYIIRFSEFACINEVNAWPHGRRNPVTYTTLGALGIDVDDLSFKSSQPQLPASTVGGVGVSQPADPIAMPLTMDAAKRGLALHYGVRPDAIEIVIRG